MTLEQGHETLHRKSHTEVIQSILNCDGEACGIHHLAKEIEPVRFRKSLYRQRLKNQPVRAIGLSKARKRICCSTVCP